MGAAGGKFAHISRENPLRAWQVTGDLGSGTYGKVHAVRNRCVRGVVTFILFLADFFFSPLGSAACLASTH
jgi:hypothetical protein